MVKITTDIGYDQLKIRFLGLFSGESRLTHLKKACSVEKRVLYIVVMLRTTTIYSP
jgi:hypothetical protein